MNPDPFFRHRDSSLFIHIPCHLRRSVLLESRTSTDELEDRLRQLPFDGMDRFEGYLTEYSLEEKTGRLVISIGSMEKGLTGIVLDFWGECECAFEAMVEPIRKIVS